MINSSYLLPEIRFTTSRSSGPGGQKVNKVSSKVTLMFDVRGSALLNEEQKEIILSKLRSRITKEGILTLSAQDTRSQLQNKEEALHKLDNLLVNAFRKRKTRKATKPSKSSVRARLQGKKLHSEKKKWRHKF